MNQKITDDDIDQICMELKKWAKERNIPKASNTTYVIPTGQTGYSGQYSIEYKIPIPDDTARNEIGEILKKLYDMSIDMVQDSITGYGFSLRDNVSKLMTLLGYVKQ